jgi:copper resistance protein D
LSTLFDIFGFLSVVLRGLDLVAQSILIGSVSFALFIAAPLAGDATREVRTIAADVRHCIQGAALAAVIAATANTAVSAAVLAASLETSWREVAGAGFVIAGSVKAVSAAAIGLLVSLRPMSGKCES